MKQWGSIALICLISFAAGHFLRSNDPEKIRLWRDSVALYQASNAGLRAYAYDVARQRDTLRLAVKSLTRSAEHHSANVDSALTALSVIECKPDSAGVMRVDTSVIAFIRSEHEAERGKWREAQIADSAIIVHDSLLLVAYRQQLMRANVLIGEAQRLVRPHHGWKTDALLLVGGVVAGRLLR